MRPFNHTSALQTELNAMEDPSPIAQLLYLVVEFKLPVKIVAPYAGLSVQTMYNYMAAEDGVHLPDAAVPLVTSLLERLKTLAAEGRLDLPGEPAERAQQMHTLLAVAETPQ